MALRSGSSHNVGKASASISIGVPDPMRKDNGLTSGLESASDSNTQVKKPKKLSFRKNSSGSKTATSDATAKKPTRRKAKKDTTAQEDQAASETASLAAIMPKAFRKNAKATTAKVTIISDTLPEKVLQETAEEVVATNLPTTMRLHQRVLINVILLIPFFFALLAFGLRQQDFKAQPERVSQVTVRGDILDSSGAVLAQGPAENRVYPHRQVAAPLIGFSGEEQAAGNWGLEGLEKTMDAHLEAGLNVTTTIDLSLQSATQQALSEAALSYNAESGTAIVLQAGTGHILAAASYPEYDPNEQERYNATQKNNRVFLQQIDPGSIFKPIVLAALLQSGKLDFSEQLPVAMDLKIGRQTFKDVMTHDEMMSVPDLLKYSSNVGMIEAAQRFEPDEMYYWLRDFGFSKPVPLDEHYTGEGSMQHYDKWVPQDQASISIGQGITVTALQLAVAYSVFANDGLLVQPRLAMVDNPPKQRPLINKQLAINMREMLVSAAQYGGARNSLVEGVRIAGKTGTADAFDHESGSYQRGDYTTSFAGIFPADDPEAVVVVMLHKPQGEKLFGSTVAAPVFQEIVSAAMSLWEAPNR